MIKQTLFYFQTFAVICSLLMAGCGSSESKVQSLGFHLPEGDIETGRELFIKFDCVYCHSVSGVELPVAREVAGPPLLMLGGEVNRVRSYGQLVTSIIDPDHVVSPQYLALLSKKERAQAEAQDTSPMPGYNLDMSVSQLVDIAAFLHSRYRLIEPDLDNLYYTTP